jgi:1-deoxy-D-xylulose-5-phosphate synthase
LARPLDVDLILALAREREILVTIAKGSMGVFASAVLQTLLAPDALDRGLKVRVMSSPDAFAGQDKPERIDAKAGIDAAAIVVAAFEAFDASAPARRALRECGNLPEDA